MLQLVWPVLLALHAVLAAVWWWVSPGDFPPSSTEYWVNQVVPVGPILFSLVGLFARGAAAPIVLPPLFAAYPVFWMSLAISLRLTFPISMGSAWNLPFIGGFVLAMLWAKQFRFKMSHPLLLPVFIAPALWAGWALPPTQRSADPATHPAGDALAEPVKSASTPSLIRLGKEAQIHPGQGRIVAKRDQLVLTVQPLPVFTDRSPDRACTDWAPPEDSPRAERKLVAVQKAGARWLLEYKDEDRSVLDVGSANGVIDLDAHWRLPQPCYSHLNSYADVTVRGHRKLTVVFSPLPGRRVELPPATAPARFAYLDANGVFHLAEASALRRGPWKELAAAPFDRGKPLELTLYDGERAVFRITLADFAAQASTQPSPTAGGGVPENSIELLRGGEAEDAPALLSFSLASTSLGRGTRSVGHAAGIYRNRMTIAQP